MVDDAGLVHLHLRRKTSAVRTEPYAVTAAVEYRAAARRQAVWTGCGRHAVLARRRAVLGRRDAVVVEPQVVFTAVKVAGGQAGWPAATAAGNATVGVTP